jgi:hypothetical protein
MPRQRDTGDGDDYAPAEEEHVASAIEEALTDLGGLDEEPDDEDEATGTITVRAQIEWAGTVDDNGRDGVRTTRLDGVKLNEIKRAAARLENAKQAGPEGGYRTYRAKGWRAQLRQALATKRGREAAAAAGLHPDTIRRWQNRTQAPSKASREKIARMYGGLRDPRAEAVRQASHGMSEALTGALRERFGVNVRLRGIENIQITED